MYRKPFGGWAPPNPVEKLSDSPDSVPGLRLCGSREGKREKEEKGRIKKEKEGNLGKSVRIKDEK